MKVLALASSKGGVGKTTVSVNLAAGLARRGHRTLFVDLDPTGNASEWLTGHQHHDRGIAEALMQATEGGEAEIATVATRDGSGVELAPSSKALRMIDIYLGTKGHGIAAMRELMQSLRRRYDFAVIDCPGSLDVSVSASVLAADGIITPVSPSFFSLRGLQQLNELVGQMRSLGGKAEILGQVLFAADPREKVTEDVRNILREQGAPFRSEVRVSTAAKSIAGDGLTSWNEGADERGAEDYEALLDETMTMLEPRARRTTAKARTRR